MNQPEAITFYRTSTKVPRVSAEQLQNLESCQTCNSSRLFFLHATSYGGYVSSKLGDPPSHGMLPKEMQQFDARGDLPLTICMDCGQLQGSWPLAEQSAEVKDAPQQGETGADDEYFGAYRGEEGERISPWDDGWSLEEYNSCVPKDKQLHFDRLEHNVLWYAGQGLSTKEIAKALDLSEKSIAVTASRSQKLFSPVEAMTLNALGRAVVDSLGKPKSTPGEALSKRARKVLGALYRNAKHGQHETVKYISRQSGYSPETTRRALLELTEQGFVLGDTVEVPHTYSITSAGVKIGGEIFGRPA